ncbi:hypothetical protein PUN28_012948 [Cardiocondyla obscurior]|uniref:Uncharacterized protein n=1 Tax=Cardiocondyla obscurior TaxID=286306 RepID=A0AAW2FB65_9HYME
MHLKQKRYRHILPPCRLNAGRNHQSCLRYICFPHEYYLRLSRRRYYFRDVDSRSGASINQSATVFSVRVR